MILASSTFVVLAGFERFALEALLSRRFPRSWEVSPMYQPQDVLFWGRDFEVILLTGHLFESSSTRLVNTCEKLVITSLKKVVAV